MNIPKPPEKIKSLDTRGQEWVKIAGECAVLVLVLLAAFLLGRISVLQNKATTEPIKVIYPPLVSANVPKFVEPRASLTAQGMAIVTDPVSTEPADWLFAASKTGKIYYPKTCSGLNRVHVENRVYFTTEAQALNAGYARSSACN